MESIVELAAKRFKSFSKLEPGVARRRLYGHLARRASPPTKSFGLYSSSSGRREAGFGRAVWKRRTLDAA